MALVHSIDRAAGGRYSVELLGINPVRRRPGYRSMMNFERHFLSASWSAWRASRTDPRAAARLTRIQARRLAELVTFARERSPYYHALLADLPDTVDAVAMLPVTRKAQLMGAFEDWSTDRRVSAAAVHAFIDDPAQVGALFRGRYAVWTTSGTTGQPGIFLHDVPALGVYAALLVTRGWLRWLPPRGRWRLLRRGVRAAIVVATGGHFAAAALQAMAERRFGSLSASSRSFAVQQPLGDLVAELNAFQPAVLAGYPTAVALLAEEQRVGRLRIRPELVATGGECLDPATQAEIAAVFGCPVRNLYGASEFMAIAGSCDHGWLHLNADWAILEPVDAAYRPVPAGTPSHTVLLTNLANRVQPVLRYDLGDSVTWGPEQCRCGSPLPALRIEGRQDEVLVLPAPDGTPVRVLPLALIAAIEATPGIERFQIIQSEAAALRIRLAVKPGADDATVWAAAVRRVADLLMALGASVARIERDSEPPRRDPRTGKFRQIWSESRR